MRSLRLALAQINPVVGDLSGNFEKILRYVEQAAAAGADLVAFPELSITGYPPEDLLLRPEFIDDNREFLNKLIPHSKEVSIITGFVDRQDDIFNAAALLHRGELAGIYHKHYLPNYSVFDENRYFQAGFEVPVYQISGINIGINICEDIWYPGGPPHYQAMYGNAEILINISASPYAVDRVHDRNRMLKVRAWDNNVILAYVNLVGGQDELVFDGNSLIIDESGEYIHRAPAFEEALIISDLSPDNVFSSRLHDPRRRKEKRGLGKKPEMVHIDLNPFADRPGRAALAAPAAVEDLPRAAEAYAALTLGIHDYVSKNRFSKVLIGLSGGIDSALVCAIAVDALGKENVTGVSMPSEFTSELSKTDAEVLAENFGIELHEIPIATLNTAFLATTAPIFKGLPVDVTEENIQARIRGNILMALSNKLGAMVLSTGNKSEFSTGYCTLYGDMAGGFAVIKDVYKLMVYDLCRYRNELAGFDIIPESTLTKPPSAELRPDQKDTDSLPPYEILDPIIHAYVELDRSVEEIIAQGFDEQIVRRVMGLINGNEYKRRQGAPGIRITTRAFGKDRRVPITNRYR